MNPGVMGADRGTMGLPLPLPRLPSQSAARRSAERGRSCGSWTWGGSWRRLKNNLASQPNPSSAVVILDDLACCRPREGVRCSVVDRKDSILQAVVILQLRYSHPDCGGLIPANPPPMGTEVLVVREPVGDRPGLLLCMGIPRKHVALQPS